MTSAIEAKKSDSERDPATSDERESGPETTKQESGSSPTATSTKRRRKAAPTLMERAIYRWVAITFVMAGFLVVYLQHPYYARGAQFTLFRSFYAGAFVLWLLLGLVYVRATLQRFSAMRYTMRDGGLHLVLLAKAVQEKRFWKTVKKPRLRTTVLGIFVKAFFTPLMTGFFAGHVNSIARAWLQHKHLPALDFKIPNGLSPLAQATTWWAQMTARIGDLVPHAADFAGLFAPSTWTRADVSWGLGLIYDIVFFTDVGWALIGYTCESRWLGNKTRSVEPTPLGWLVALACYPPFNNVTGTYLPLNDGHSVITGENALLVMRAASVFLFAIYASATVSFGFKFSNLTNRGIVSRGPYRLVRHPAYLCKCLAWWLEHLPTISFSKAFFLTLLCGLYSLRAWTEERHLSRDPDYRAYKKKVPWVLVPGVY